MEERERKSGGDAKISDDFAKELEEMEKLRGSAAAAGDAAAAQARGPEGSEGSPSNSEDSAPAEAAEEEMDMASALEQFEGRPAGGESRPGRQGQGQHGRRGERRDPRPQGGRERPHHGSRERDARGERQGGGNARPESDRRSTPKAAFKREILANTSFEESRVAILENGRLVELLWERRSAQSIVGNIYKGVVENVLPGISSAFVNIGFEKNAYLYISDVLGGSRAPIDQT
ncbi:MAG: hypothetical protein AAB578_04315, partial [Elusimicrobiota bacterium]